MKKELSMPIAAAIACICAVIAVGAGIVWINRTPPPDSHALTDIRQQHPPTAEMQKRLRSSNSNAHSGVTY